MAVSSGATATTAFPRGKKPKRSSEASLDAVAGNKKDGDDLFQTRVDLSKEEKKREAKKRAKKSDKEKTSKAPVSAGATSHWKSRAEPLTYRSLSEGMVLLGVVSSVTEFQLRVSLPGHLVGTVGITAVSKPYTKALRMLAEAGGEEQDTPDVRQLKDMFSPGQVVLCAVQKVEEVQRRNDPSSGSYFRVSLSLSPQSVQVGLTSALVLGSKATRSTTLLQAAVSSVEDHGYVMDTGVAGLKGFLPHKKAQRYVEDVLGGVAPSVGQLLPCLIAGRGSSTVTLSCEPIKLKNAVCDAAEASVHTMLPGTCFKARVKKLPSAGEGLELAFGDFVGYVPPDQRDYANESPQVDDIVHARVLYVMPTVNAVHLTLKPHLRIGLKPDCEGENDPLKKIQVGQGVKEAEVVVTNRRHVVLKLGKGAGLVGFVTPSQLPADTTGDISNKFPVGSRHSCQVIQYDYASAMFVCSMQKHQLSHKMLVNVEQLKPGDRVSCVVREHGPNGVVVDVATTNRRSKSQAFIPTLHLSDVPLKDATKKFPQGTKLACRVLRADPERRNLILTHKSILVKEEFPVVSDYSSAQVGIVTEGVVTRVGSDGLLLTLFGNVRGFVPKSKISSDPIDYPEKLFFLGQVLKCKVVEVGQEVGGKEKMILSLILGDHHKPLGSKQRKEAKVLSLGALLSPDFAVVVDVSEEGLTVEVSVEGREAKVKAFLPKYHLTDHPAVAEAVLRSYSAGDKLDREAVCFEQDVVPVLSMKRSLLDFAKSAAAGSAYEDLHEGLVMPAVVSSMKNFGVFLRLPAWKFNKVALAPMRLLADAFVEKPSDVVIVHQTVVAKVIEKDDREQKVTMSIRLSDVTKQREKHHGGEKSADTGSEALSFLASLLEDLETARRLSKNKHLASFHPGDVVSGVVTLVTDLGLEMEIGTTRAIVTNAGLTELSQKPSVGEQLSGVVVFVDFEFSCLEVTASPSLLMARCSAVKKKRRRLKPETKTVSASVVLVKSELQYLSLCVRCGPHAGRFVHVSTRSHLNDFLSATDDCFAIGDSCNVVICRNLAGDNYIGVLEERRRRQRQDKRKLKNDRGDLDVPSTKRARTESEMSNEASTVSAASKATATATLSNTEVVDPGWDEDYDPWSSSKDRKKMATSAPSSSDPEAKKVKTHISKKEKKELDRLEAEEIARAERRAAVEADGGANATALEPETPDEFDRMVLASPDSSLCWIKYMAHHMQRQETDKARLVAERALEKINVREEQERLNLYMAWLNLEVDASAKEGSDDKVEELLARALKYNDQYAVYVKAAEVFARTERHRERAERLHKTFAKKFCRELEPWTLLGSYYYTTGQLKEARFTLQRSVQNLEKKHHVSVTTKFALMEFRAGEVERGKSVFETLVTNYPGRTDLWSVYVDALVSAGEVEAARAVLERATERGSESLQPKKMKFLFKKLLAFEERHGDQQSVDRVRKRALEYVEMKVGGLIGEDDASLDEQA